MLSQATVLFGHLSKATVLFGHLSKATVLFGHLSKATVLFGHLSNLKLDFLNLWRDIQISAIQISVQRIHLTDSHSVTDFI